MSTMCQKGFYLDPGTQKCQSCRDVCNFNVDHTLSRDCKTFCIDDYNSIMESRLVTTTGAPPATPTDPDGGFPISHPLVITLIALLGIFVAIIAGVVFMFKRYGRKRTFEIIAAPSKKLWRNIKGKHQSQATQNISSIEEPPESLAITRQDSATARLLQDSITSAQGSEATPTAQSDQLGMRQLNARPRSGIGGQPHTSPPAANGHIYRPPIPAEASPPASPNVISNPAYHPSSYMGCGSSTADLSLRPDSPGQSGQGHRRHSSGLVAIGTCGPITTPSDDHCHLAKLTTGQELRQSHTMLNGDQETRRKTVD